MDDLITTGEGNIIRERRTVAWLLVGLVLFSLPCALHAQKLQEIDKGESIALVLNAEVSPSELSLGSLRAIFTMRKRAWENSTPIRVFVLPDSNPVHLLFCKSVLKIYPFVLREQWDQLIFSGTGFIPTEIKNERDLRDVVSRTPGAIGYIQRPPPLSGADTVPEMITTVLDTAAESAMSSVSRGP